MLTPQEIQDKKFEKAMFGGYDMGQIDDFLDAVLNDYTALYKENAALKGKMRVLVDKIEEYRAVDEQMRKALYAAQVSARDIVIKAQSEADSMLAEAKRTVDMQVGDLKEQVLREERRLQQVKAECSEYATRIKTMLSKNIEVIDLIIEKPTAEFVDTAKPQPPKGEFKINFPEEVSAPLVQPVDLSDTQEVAPAGSISEAIGISSSVAAENIPQGGNDDEMHTEFFEINLGGKTEEPAHKKHKNEPESDTGKIYGDSPFTPKPRFNFDDLKFGSGYEEDNNDEE